MAEQISEASNEKNQHPVPAIATRGLTRSFGQLAAVTDLSLHVPPGSVYGFLGLNGAGKSTTIRMLLGLLRPTSGAVARALETVGLTDAGRRLAREYSTGMRQRLGLALALMGEPELLILDEPTNGLDPRGIQEVRDLVRGLPGRVGVTVFLSSHILAEVEQVASHVGIIHRGRLVAQGALEDLLGRGLLRVGVSDSTAARERLVGQGWSARAGDHGTVLRRCVGTDVLKLRRTSALALAVFLPPFAAIETSLPRSRTWPGRWCSGGALAAPLPTS